MKIQSHDLYLFFKISKVLSYMLHTRPKEWATHKAGSRDADASKNWQPRWHIAKVIRKLFRSRGNQEML